MSSPPRDAPISPSTPVSIQGGSPHRRRSVSPSNISDRTSRARHSPTLTRSFDPNDPDVRERQRTMDVDMAMQLSRARRETLSISTTTPQDISQPITDAFPVILSPQEEHEIGIARGEGLHMDDGDLDADTLIPNRSFVDLHDHLQHGHDPSLLAARDGLKLSPRDVEPPQSINGLPTYQANASRSNFDFAPMEAFAADEKAELGIISPVTRFSISALRGKNGSNGAQNEQSADASPESNVTSPRMARHRKLSQSNPNPRLHRKGIGGKMALFERNLEEPSPSLPARLGLMIGGQGLSLEPSFDNLAGLSGAGGVTSADAILNTGHDRPYRFSFYSNALSATIHARSLCELPAEGQTFEDLFTGVFPSASSGHNHDRTKETPSSTFSPPEGILKSSEAGPSMNGGNFKAPLNGNSHSMKRRSGFSEVSRTGNHGGAIDGQDFDGSTWWLDVQSPTDEEMKMLSKVFSIHPLTTEDIQMEETREKIELFRNYYLVCFRSFDQDPYSPTHLEPLNMYIIVFREGTLSFHFRPTPHPQSVRRRIKQLKDYISVTSDWISYALIDDITDAFGPLIQSIEYEVDSIDELVLILKEAEQSDMLRRIGTCRKKVMGLLRLMGNKADVVKGLAKRCNENWRVAPTSDIGLYLSDIQDHLITMTQNLNHYEKILSRSHSNYLAQISIEMTDANNQINDVLSKLTALGTILIPMNLVTGLWGMNVHVPGQDVPGYAWFVSIIACLAAFACIGGYTTYKFMMSR